MHMHTHTHTHIHIQIRGVWHTKHTPRSWHSHDTTIKCVHTICLHCGVCVFMCVITHLILILIYLAPPLC